MKTFPSSGNPTSTDYRTTLITAAALTESPDLAAHLRASRDPGSSSGTTQLRGTVAGLRAAELKRLALRQIPRA
ncbi:MAG: hypothetical protein V2J12_08465 [Gammaproteobacteria bacterium]|jgi:hypothetical protein|nr:hypothetical protein [Gammaproteobacteria bacterium]